MGFFKDSVVPRHWFIGIFGIKVIVSIGITIIYTNYYTNRDTADIFKYFDDSMILFDSIKTNPTDYVQMLLGLDMDHNYFTVNYYHFMHHWIRPYSNDLISDSHVIIRFNAFVRLFSFGHFQVHNIFINFVSLLGLTAIFKAFRPYLVNKERVLFYVIFLVPSILFWGSGLLKESIIFFALGLILNNLFRLTKGLSVSKIILILIGALLIVYTKFYLLIAFAIPIFGWGLNHFFKLKRVYLGYLIAGLSFFVAVIVAPYIHESLDFVFQIANKQQDFSRFLTIMPANTGFHLPELTDGYSLLRNIPNALLNTVIRPFLWECQSLFVWMSGLENLLILICIALALIFRKKMEAVQFNIFLFNLIFVFVLFTIIGLTTPVFGAIMRYKIPGLILLLISLLLFVDLEKIKRKSSLLNKIL